MKGFVTAACALCGALGSQGLPEEGRKSRPRTDAREKGSKTKAHCWGERDGVGELALLKAFWLLLHFLVFSPNFPPGPF